MQVRFGSTPHLVVIPQRGSIAYEMGFSRDEHRPVQRTVGPLI